MELFLFFYSDERMWVSSHYFAIGGVDMRSQVGVVKEDVSEDFLKSIYK